jgi:hypothetical protein
MLVNRGFPCPRVSKYVGFRDAHGVERCRAVVVEYAHDRAGPSPYVRL